MRPISSTDFTCRQRVSQTGCVNELRARQCRANCVELEKGHPDALIVAELAADLADFEAEVLEGLRHQRNREWHIDVSANVFDPRLVPHKLRLESVDHHDGLPPPRDKHSHGTLLVVELNGLVAGKVAVVCALCDKDRVETIPVHQELGPLPSALKLLLGKVLHRFDSGSNLV